MEDLIKVGQILGTYKLKGEVKCSALLDEFADLVGKTVLLQNSKTKKDRVLEIENIKRINAKKIALKFKGVDFITEAQTLNLMEIYIRRDILGLTEDEFFISDLLDMSVQDVKRGELGTVRDILETGAHDILVVRHGDNEILIPNTEPFVQEIDFEQKRIIVELIEGM